MKKFVAVFFLGMSALPLHFAAADQAKPMSDAQVLSEMQNADENAVRAAGLQTADQIRQIPAELQAQGIQTSSEEQAHINAVADQLANEAGKPGFKKTVIQSMKKSRHFLSRVGIDTLKGLGYSGDAVFWACFAPWAFGMDLTTGAVLGRGVISTGAKNSTEEDLGGFGGAITFGYLYTGLASVGFTLYGPILASSLGVVIVDAAVCRHADDNGNTERDRFCRINEQVIRHAVIGRSARLGEIIGDGIHEGVIKTAHVIEYPFRDKRDDREDDMGN